MACNLVKIHSSVKNINPRGGSSIIEVNNNSIIMFGGADREQTAFQDMLVYKKGNNIFHSIKSSGDVPMPRSGHAVVNYGKYMILFGGIDFAEEAVFNDLYILDTDSMEWNYIGESGIEIIARNSHSLGIVKDDVNNRSYLVVYGGASPEHGPLGDTIYAEIPYDPTTIDMKSFFVKWELLIVGISATISSTNTTNSTVFTDIESNSSTYNSPLTSSSPGPREMHGTCSFQGIMIISGGRNEHQLLSDVWILRATTTTNGSILDASIVDKNEKHMTYPPLVWDLCDILKLPYPLCTHGTSVISCIHSIHTTNSNNTDDILSNTSNLENNLDNNLDSITNNNENISLPSKKGVRIVYKLVIIGGFAESNGGISDKIITINIPDYLIIDNNNNNNNNSKSITVDNKEATNDVITNNKKTTKDNIVNNNNNNSSSLLLDNTLKWNTMKLNIPIEGRLGLSVCNLSIHLLIDIVNNKKYNTIFNEELKHKVLQYNTTTNNSSNRTSKEIENELTLGLLIFGGVSIEKDFGDLYLLINS